MKAAVVSSFPRRHHFDNEDKKDKGGGLVASAFVSGELENHAVGNNTLGSAACNTGAVDISLPGRGSYCGRSV